MHRLLPANRPRLRTRLATYAIALVALPLGFAWGYVSKDWPVRHRLWALWLVAPLAWAWTRLARLAWTTILQWTLGAVFMLAIWAAILVTGDALRKAVIAPLWHAVIAPSPHVSTPAPPRSDTTQTTLFTTCVMDTSVTGKAGTMVVASVTTAGWCHQQDAAPATGIILGTLAQDATTAGVPALIAVQNTRYTPDYTPGSGVGTGRLTGPGIAMPAEYQPTPLAQSPQRHTR
jgi:hypothetical protein